MLIHSSKGSVVFASSPQAVNEQIKIQIESNLNLDKPLLEQYLSWAKGVLKGDFGFSLINGESVNNILKERLPHTLTLTISAFALLFFLSLFLGVLSVIYRDTLFDRIINIVCMSFFALPSFALSLALILVFSVFLGIFPSSGVSDLGFEQDFFNKILHLILPVSALVLSHLAVFLRLTRTALIESLNQGFIEAAFARGLSIKRIYFHFILIHALSSIITYFAASFVSFIMNAVVIENVFAYEGIGNLLVKSILFKDYPIVLAILSLSIIAVTLVNIFAQYLCKIINPRQIYA
ncbi:ABC transporter permease [Campylobacter sp. MIT 12-8780]|nr:ABC transporter permease [Campylobacter sp. MIT 19-121]TQR41091.1 ABC transporter permease [Campylobacter sp. MIT 12-8780]